MKINPLQDEISEYVAVKRRQRSRKTAEQYQSVLDGQWLPWATEVRITDPAQMDDKALNAFTDHLEARRDAKGEPLSPYTVRTYLRALQAFLRWCDVPRGKYQQPRKPGPRTRDVLSRHEIDLLERAADDERSRLIVRVLAETGIRVGELIKLRPEDLKEFSHDRQYFLRVVGKGDKERLVACPGPTFMRLQGFVNLNDQPYIFNGRRRRGGRIQPLTASGVEQLISELADRANIGRRVWPHLLRHSYVTRKAIERVPMDFVRRQLGHTSLSMISEIYSHITPSDMYEALTKG